MPNHKVHKYCDLLLFGRSYPKVHMAIDAPAKIFGRKHRKYFHDANSAALISQRVCGDPRPGIMHKLVDEACSKDSYLKKVLEVLASGRRFK